MNEELALDTFKISNWFSHNKQTAKIHAQQIAELSIVLSLNI